MPATRPAIYLHVGPPKTGTTYLQDVLFRNQAALTLAMVDVPGGRPVEHFHAALDLRGIQFGGYENPDVPGAWEKLSRKVLTSSAAKVVISHEALAGATDEIETVGATFDGHDLHIIYGARDLARQLPAVWQETLKNRQTRPYDKFLRGALKAEQTTKRSARFWRAQDVVSTLERWSRVVPPERIHVMTLAHTGAPADTLWRRFCQALDIAPDGYDLEVARSNSSLSLQDAEVLRRLNGALPCDLPWPAYERIVKRRFNQRANSENPRDKIVVPARYRDLVMERAEQARAALSAASYAVNGDLDDLIPRNSSFGELPELPADMVTDAAVALLANVLTEQAEQHSRAPREVVRSRLSQLRRGRGAS
ncbi:MAG: hypothetical protein ACR2GB_02515 [Nocardioidaceae bacterium]